MKSIEKQVEKILYNVKTGGDKAVQSFLKKFDGVRLKPSQFRIPQSKIRRALYIIPHNLRKSLMQARKNISAFYGQEKSQTAKNWSLKSVEKIIGQKWVSIDSVGVYVPGGRFSYPSTVLMGAVPARVAGVKRIVCISPPGKITNEVLAAAWIAGVNEFYQIGGPAGIAALAYGTKTIKPVDMIVGPGNVYVTAAKKLLYGVVGIDMLAGPSEVAIVVDDEQYAEFIMQDVLAQREHDANARAWIISLNKNLTALIKAADTSINICTVETIAQAAEKINALAPEHLQLLTRENKKLFSLVRSAGTIFVGKNTPVAIGDYIAGPSHILPTGRTARFSSGLSISNFYKKINYIEYLRVSDDFTYAARMAESEGMHEHGESLRRRIG